MRPSIPLLALVFLLTGLISWGVPHATAQIVWDGGGDGTSWNDAQNWNPDTVPSSGSAVEVSTSATITVGTARGVASLLFSGGALIGSGQLTVTSQMEWQDGTIGIDVTVPSGATLSITNSREKALTGAILTINSGGGVVWSGGDVTGSNGAKIINNGTWTNQVGFNDLRVGSGTAPLFTNSGTYTYTGSNQSGIQWRFETTGVVRAESGRLFLDGGGSFGAGTLLQADGGVLDLTDGTFALNGTTLASSNGGVVNFGGATITGTGPQPITDRLDWTRGTVSVDLTIADGAILNRFSLDSTLDGAILTVESGGTVTWSNGDITGSNGAQIVNAGTWTHQGTSDDLRTGSGTAPLFTNTGTYVYTGSNQSGIQWRFESTGPLRAKSGRLSLDGGGSFGSGTLLQADGGILNLDDGTFALNGTTLASTNGGTVNFGGATIGGTGPQPITDRLDWTSGTVTVNLTIASGATLNRFGRDVALDGAALTVESGGTVTWNSGDITGGNGAQIVNAGTWTHQGTSDDLRTGSGTAPLFTNTGTYVYTGSNQSGIRWRFEATGPLRAASGRLSLDGGGSFGAGTLLQAAGGILDLDGGTFALNGTTLASTNGGAVDFGGATIAGTGPQPITDRLDWTSGTVTVNLTIASGATLNRFGRDVALDGATLTVGGSLTNAVFDGTVRPGASSVSETTFLDFDGDFTAGAASSSGLSVDIAGPTAGTDHDQMRVVGSAALGGTLEVTFASGYIPAVGTSFPVLLTTGSVNGTFDTLVLPPNISIRYDPSAVVVEVDGVIPVELSGFDGVWREDVPELRWVTATETNNAGFEVQRRTSATGSWSTLTFIKGRGTTSEASDYVYRDATFPYTATTAEYRLRQMDLDGTYTFGPTITMERQAPETIQLRAVYPHPVVRQTTVRYELPEAGPVEIVVYDLWGRVVDRVVVASTDAGRHEFRLDASRYSPGTYFLRLKTRTSVLSRRLTVVR